MAKNRRKSAAIALAVIGIAGLSLASASQLNINGNSTLQAGTQDLTGCQGTTAVNARVAAGSYAAATGFAAGAPTISNINAACAGKTITVQLITASPANAPLGAPVTMVIPAPVGPATTSVATLPAVAGVSANAVGGVAVVISE